MGASRIRGLSPRREMMLTGLLGLVGAGLVFLAVRQGWAHVRTAAPRPLPGSDVRVTGQDLVPAAGAVQCTEGCDVSPEVLGGYSAS